MKYKIFKYGYTDTGNQKNDDLAYITLEFQKKELDGHIRLSPVSFWRENNLSNILREDKSIKSSAFGTEILDILDNSKLLGRYYLYGDKIHLYIQEVD